MASLIALGRFKNWRLCKVVTPCFCFKPFLFLCPSTRNSSASRLFVKNIFFDHVYGTTDLRLSIASINF